MKADTVLLNLMKGWLLGETKLIIMPILVIEVVIYFESKRFLFTHE